MKRSVCSPDLSILKDEIEEGFAEKDKKRRGKGPDGLYCCCCLEKGVWGGWGLFCRQDAVASITTSDNASPLEVLHQNDIQCHLIPSRDVPSIVDSRGCSEISILFLSKLTVLDIVSTGHIVYWSHLSP